MGDEFEVNPDALRSAAADLDEHAAQVASHGETLDANTASPVGHGAIGEAVDAAVKRALRVVAHDLSTAVHKFYTDAASLMRKTAAETERRDAEAKQAFDELGGGRRPATSAGIAGARPVAAGYRRSPFTELSPDETEQVKREFQEIGGDPSMLTFNTGAATGYLDGGAVIQVRGDVFPSGPPDPAQPNATMSSRAVLAHELGHHHFDVGEDHSDYLPAGCPEDEMRASRWAAEHIPGLTDQERRFLLMDARSRGCPLPSDPFVLRMLYGITESST
jgi:uncharacterized protein YukE